MLFLIVLLGISFANAKLLFDPSDGMEQGMRIDINNKHETTTPTTSVDPKEQKEMAEYAEKRFRALYFYVMSDKSPEHRSRNQRIMEYIRGRYPHVQQEAERAMVEVIKLLELFAVPPPMPTGVPPAVPKRPPAMPPMVPPAAPNRQQL